MPVQTYHTRVDVAGPAIISGGTQISDLGANTFSSYTVSKTRQVVLVSSLVDETANETYRRTHSGAPFTDWSYAYTEANSYTTQSRIASYGSSAVTYHSTFSQKSTGYTVDQGFRSVYSQADDDDWGATEVEAFGTVNNALVYSFSRTSRARQAVGRTITGTSGGQSLGTTAGTTSSTSYTSSAGKFFRNTYRVNVTTAVGQNLTRRYVTSSSTRTHTLTFGGSTTYTFTTTTNPAATITLTVTRTSTSYPGSQSVTVTQRVPVTSTSFTTRTISWYQISGSHYHFSDSPATVYGNLVDYDDLTTSAQQIVLLPTSTGFQYSSQFSALSANGSATFSFSYGSVGQSGFGNPTGSTGTLTLVYDSYASTSMGSIVLRQVLSTINSEGVDGLAISGNFQTTQAVLTPQTVTLTTGQSFSAPSSSSSSGTGISGSSTQNTTHGYVTASGAGTISTTLAKTLREALGTTTSSRTMRLLATSTSQSTLARSFTAGSTVWSETSRSQTSVAHGTVDPVFYVRTFSVSEHAADVPGLRYSQELLIGNYIPGPDATAAYNTLGTALMFWVSTYGANNVTLSPARPTGILPLNGTAVRSSSYYTQSYSISSNSTSLSFTYRAITAPASQTSTSSHVKTMGGTLAKVTVHNNYSGLSYDSTVLRSFLSGTGGAYSTGGSEAALLETPSFVGTAIHGTVGLNGTAGYNFEHDLVFGSGTAGSHRNVGASTSSFPVSRSLASQRIFYGNQITSGTPAWSDCVPGYTVLTINPFRTIAPA